MVTAISVVTKIAGVELTDIVVRSLGILVLAACLILGGYQCKVCIRERQDSRERDKT